MPWFALLKYPDGTPRGRWIWPVGGHHRQQTALFTATLSIPHDAVRLEIHLTAEGRYTLWLDDQRDALGRGPARNDLQHRSLDVYEIDFSEQRPPSNSLTLWAQVRWWPGPPEAPLAEMFGPVPGFLAIALFFDHHGNVVASHGTGHRADHPWHCCLAAGLSGHPIEGIPAFVCIGLAEDHHSSGFPTDWRTDRPQALSEPWQLPDTVGDPYFRDDPALPTGPPSPHGWLIEREVAHPEERLIPLRHIRLQGGHASCDLPSSLGQFRVGPGETVRLRIDVGEQVLAYMRLSVSGTDTAVSIGSGEVFYAPDHPDDPPLPGGTAPWTGRKVFSIDAPANARLHPLVDRYTHDSTSPSHRFESAHWRAFRFLEIELAGGPRGGALDSFELIGTGYPFQRVFEFDARPAEEPPSPDSSPPQDPEPVADTIEKIVDISWRTLRCCTWETYMDCPYYEQLQYIGDTRLHCLITYVTTGDVTLPAQALRAFDRSRFTGGAEGLTLSRYPASTAVAQVIPTFSLLYILMIEDYLVHTGDEALVAEIRPGIAPILNWFNQFINPDTGLIGRMRYWPFVDWVHGWFRGVPPHRIEEAGIPESASPPALRPTSTDVSSLINLHYLLALQSASRIYERSKSGSGNLYAGRAAILKQRIYDTFFDAGRGLVCDIPLRHPHRGGGDGGAGRGGEGGRGRLGVWSQHAQALAVLADLLSPTEARAAMETALDPRNTLRPGEPVGDERAAKEGRFLAPASLYFRFYLAEALAALRMGDHLWPLLEPFRAAIRRGSTTWPESLEPARSECHAWSSWPLYFFARHLLGITPPGADDRTGTAGKGDGRIRVRPLACPPLTFARGRFHSPRGSVDVKVHWSSNGTGGFHPPEIQAAGAGVDISRVP